MRWIDGYMKWIKVGWYRLLFLIFIFPYVYLHESIENGRIFLEEIDERSEKELLIYYRMKKHLINLKSKEEMYKIIMKLCERKYYNLIVEILKEKELVVKNYFYFLQQFCFEEELIQKVFEIPRFYIHIQKYIKRKKLLYEPKLHFQIQYGKEEKECLVCLESIEKKHCIECDYCHIQLNFACMIQWIKNRNTQCILCRNTWVDGIEIGILKYIYYKWLIETKVR